MHGHQAFSQATPNASQHTTVVSTSSLLFVVCSTAITHYVANCQRTACGRACSSCAKNSMCGWVGQTVSGWLGRREGGRGGPVIGCVGRCASTSLSCHAMSPMCSIFITTSCHFASVVQFDPSGFVCAGFAGDFTTNPHTVADMVSRSSQRCK